MKVVAYKIFEFLFWTISSLSMLLFIGVLFIAANGGNVDTAGPAVILSLPVTILGIIWLRLSSTFEVRKYRSTRRYQKAIERIKQTEQKNRSILSRQCELRNIGELIDIAKDELMKRRLYITPNVLARMELILEGLRKKNNVPSLNTVYSLIVSTKQDSLNGTISEY